MPARSLYLNQLNRTEDLTQPNFTQPLALTRGREYLIAFLHQLEALLLPKFCVKHEYFHSFYYSGRQLTQRRR